MNNATAIAVAFSFVGSQRWVTHGSDLSDRTIR